MDRKLARKKKTGRAKTASAKKTKTTAKKKTTRKRTGSIRTKEKPRAHTRFFRRFSVSYLANFIARDGRGDMLVEGSGIVSDLSIGGAQILQPEFMGGISFPCPNFEIDFQEGPLSGVVLVGEIISARDFSGRCAFGIRFDEKRNKKHLSKLEKFLLELSKN